MIVLYGPEPGPQEGVFRAVARAARLEDMPVHYGVPAVASSGLVMLQGPAAGSEGAALAAAGWPVLVVIASPVPLPELLPWGALHLDARGPLGLKLSSGALTAAGRALLAAVTDGPVSIAELASALEMGAHALLDVAEPLLDAGLLVEVDDGASLGPPPS